MKKSIVLGIGIAALMMGGCVESSQKYKDLLARADSLGMVADAQHKEMEAVFAGINDISSGIQSLREAENLLVLEAGKEAKGETASRQQLMRLKNDVQAMAEAIVAYKSQVADLEKKNTRQSVQFRKMISTLEAELEERSEKIAEITRQLAETHQELAGKVREVEELTRNVASLDQETKSQKRTINAQDEEIHKVHYLVGARKDLKKAEVISRQGLFCPPIVSSQAQKADFITVDMREITSIPLNSRKARILSVHPADSYVIETEENGDLVLKINDAARFWKQTRYLVVMAG